MKRNWNQLKQTMQRFTRNELTDQETSQLMREIATLSDVELASLLAFHDENTNGTSSESDILTDSDHLTHSYQQRLQSTWERIHRQTAPQVQAPSFRQRTGWRRLSSRSAAAAILLLLGIGITAYLVQQNQRRSLEMSEARRAVTTESYRLENDELEIVLPNGKHLALDPVEETLIAHQDHLAYKNGRMLSQVETFEDSDEITLRNPKGRIQHVQLPDGSQIWLKPGTEITFPSPFTGRNRRVSLQGEAFFDVNRSLNTENGQYETFIVHTPTQQIHVLGTQFNVAAYDKQTHAKTTLLTGSVQLIQIDLNETPETSTDTVLLKPGQQAHYDGGRWNLVSVDADDAADWINGNLSFNRATLREVMDELSNWYPIDAVEFHGHLPENRFSGKISRNLELIEVFKALSAYQVAFEYNERIVKVRSK